MNEIQRMYVRSEDLHNESIMCKSAKCTEVVLAVDYDNAVKSQWQPIRTAPAEGQFLVYLPNELYKVQSARRSRNGIFIIGNCFAFDLSPATHWMPQPESPR